MPKCLQLHISVPYHISQLCENKKRQPAPTTAIWDAHTTSILLWRAQARLCNGSDITNAHVTNVDVTEAWYHTSVTSCLTGSQLVVYSIKVTTDSNVVIHSLASKHITQTTHSISRAPCSWETPETTHSVTSSVAMGETNTAASSGGEWQGRWF